MKRNQHLLSYLIGIVTFLCFKFAYTAMDAGSLSFILGPTDYFVSILTDSNAIYIPNVGYYHHELNITIEKSCSGFNFLLLSFLITYCVSASHLRDSKLKWSALPLSLLFDWMLTIFVNTSRITSSIFIGRYVAVSKPYQALLHQAEGTFIYLFFLILSYRLINHLLKNYAVQYEKPA